MLFILFIIAKSVKITSYCVNLSVLYPHDSINYPKLMENIVYLYKKYESYHFLHKHKNLLSFPICFY